MTLTKKKLVFLTGTRADFGKLKSLIEISKDRDEFEVFVFVTGMHLLQEYGYTLLEVEKCGYKNIHAFPNHTDEKTMDLSLAKTIQGFSSFIKEINPDLIVVHGDRIEAMAGAIVGALNNILVAHVEGGELSGTIDELIRHSVSKMSHIHFVSNQKAKERLVQMGELPESIFVIGSPDVDLMLSPNLPDIHHVKAYYQINFESYAVAMFHPVTTEYKSMAEYAKNFVDALIESEKEYVVIYPNNDLGSKFILKEYERLLEYDKFRIFPSIRFEYFLTLLKNAQFMVGNSSAGIREAPYYGIPVVNIGTRQLNRALHEDILNCGYQKDEILALIHLAANSSFPKEDLFGAGNSDTQFLESMLTRSFWEISCQKQFIDKAFN
ncbi:UDP-N-acetylglucosamine 2-epimerase (hydrolysing) [Algoriphagus aquaeductus]|uniref:UDP-N-acetylglucosamine 2-epimerase (Hydrolysing) n=1 Tax=Algoriphagus aquaeductus TaxID=475299 RepID=A0A326RKT5_9BACT|nr:UDP-N-acetylglucosamine 2-epimerase [Algoriphagus aquaeductus]PZV79141.1 UDP-N-acetylglucosamine 2-epimerase (hydrolysing) [Algoriphagus aquaeductus]